MGNDVNKNVDLLKELDIKFLTKNETKDTSQSYQHVRQSKLQLRILFMHVHVPALRFLEVVCKKNIKGTRYANKIFWQGRISKPYVDTLFTYVLSKERIILIDTHIQLFYVIYNTRMMLAGSFLSSSHHFDVPIKCS